jgi:hypothetical protein
MSIQDTIRRIQEEAKRKVEVARFSKSKQPLPEVAAPVEIAPTTIEVVESLREQLSTAIAQALSTKAARRYIGDVTEELQNIATEVIESVRNVTDFGGAVKTDNNDVVIYPKNCKLLVQNSDGRGSLIIEEPPQYRTALTGAGRTAKNYRIAMPYMVYLIGFQYQNGRYINAGCGIGFGKKPIDSIKTRLLNPKLPHTQGNYHVCQPLKIAEHKTVKELGEYVVQTFWSTIFHYTFEMANCQFQIEGKKINSFADWSKIENPLDILKANFDSGNTVQEVLSQLGQVQETRSMNTSSYKIQSAVTRVVNGVNRSLSANELSEVIRRTAEEIVNAALQNAVGDSALQH